MVFLVRAAPVLLVSMFSWGQEQDFTVRLEVPVVSLDVSVTDEDGLPVTGLLIDDFELLDNGVAQPLQYFGPATAPYHLHLLLDTSASTDDQRPLMLEVIEGFIDSARPQDRISVGLFGNETETLIDWTDSREDARARIGAWNQFATTTGTTELYRALENTLERSFAGIPERRAVIVLSDGRDLSLYQELQQRGRLLPPEADEAFRSISEIASESGIPIYFVATNTDQNLDAGAPGNEYDSLGRMYPDLAVADSYLEQVRVRMESLASQTGGRVLFPRTAAEVSPLFEQIAGTLGQAYSLGWAPRPGNDAQVARTIEVRVSEPAYTVRQSRSEYAP